MHSLQISLIARLFFLFIILLETVSAADQIVLLKLGGSSITDKSQFETLDQAMLDWVASTLTLAKNSTTKFVIVHGAGSFGHHTSKQYGIKGQSDLPSLELHGNDHAHIMEGMAKTRLSVTKLNWEVVRTLVENSIPAVSISPYAVGLQAHGEPILDKYSPIAALVHVVQATLNENVIPVLHGDALLYGKNNVGILSGDTIISMLCKASNFKPTSVLFLTDVDGVYTSDPKHDPSAELLPEININSDGEIKQTVCASESVHDDVTGGLKLKLSSAIEIAREGIPVRIVRCGSDEAQQAILGKSVDGGTLIKLN